VDNIQNAGILCEHYDEKAFSYVHYICRNQYSRLWLFVYLHLASGNVCVNVGKLSDCRNLFPNVSDLRHDSFRYFGVTTVVHLWLWHPTEAEQANRPTGEQANRRIGEQANRRTGGRGLVLCSLLSVITDLRKSFFFSSVSSGRCQCRRNWPWLLRSKSPPTHNYNNHIFSWGTVWFIWA
jgi:hypothetical protein